MQKNFVSKFNTVEVEENIPSYVEFVNENVVHIIRWKHEMLLYSIDSSESDLFPAHFLSSRC